MGLWWGPRGSASLPDQPPKTWRWRLLVRTATVVGVRDLAKAQKDIAARGKVPEIATVKLEAMEHLAEERGSKPRGMHHEIYLSDPRRVPPAKLRTILRHSLALRPVRVAT